MTIDNGYIKDCIEDFDNLSAIAKLNFLKLISNSHHLLTLSIENKVKIILAICELNDSSRASIIDIFYLKDGNQITNYLSCNITTNQENMIKNFIICNKNVFTQSKSRILFLMKFANINKSICDFVIDRYFEWHLESKNGSSGKPSNWWYVNFPLTIFRDICITNKFVDKRKILLFLLDNEKNFAVKDFIPVFPELENYKLLV